MRWYFHTASGLAIRSVIPLPALPEGGDGRDVCMQWQELPEVLSEPVHSAHDHQARPGIALLHRRSGRFLVRDGSEVGIHPDSQQTERAVAQTLAGIVIGVLLHQRKQLPLHASAVAHGAQGILLLGRRGAGKSTLAAHLHQRGYQVLCDDYCALAPPAEGPIPLKQGTRYLKLEPGAVEALGLSVEALGRLPTLHPKYGYPIDDTRKEEVSVSLRAIVLLAGGPTVTLECLTPARAFHVIRRFTYRRGYIQGLGLTESHFRLCSYVAATVPVFQLRRSPTALEAALVQLELLLHRG